MECCFFLLQGGERTICCVCAGFPQRSSNICAHVKAPASQRQARKAGSRSKSQSELGQAPGLPDSCACRVACLVPHVCFFSISLVCWCEMFGRLLDVLGFLQHSPSICILVKADATANQGGKAKKARVSQPIWQPQATETDWFIGVGHCHRHSSSAPASTHMFAHM